jgi:hypothetical protein
MPEHPLRRQRQTVGGVLFHRFQGVDKRPEQRIQIQEREEYEHYEKRDVDNFRT